MECGSQQLTFGSLRLLVPCEPDGFSVARRLSSLIHGPQLAFGRFKTRCYEAQPLNAVGMGTNQFIYQPAAFVEVRIARAGLLKFEDSRSFPAPPKVSARMPMNLSAESPIQRVRAVGAVHVGALALGQS